MTDLALEVGGDGPPLVLVHAAIGDRRQWDDLVDHLPGYTHVRYDVRGFGESPDPDGDFYDHDDTLAVLDHAGIERAVFVGASNGGRIVADLAVEAPDRVAGLALVSASLPGQQWGPEYDEPSEEFDRLMAAGDYEGAAAIDREIFLVGPNRSLDDIDPRLVARLTPWFQQMSRREATQFAGGEPQPVEPPLRERLAELTAPTLVLVGEHDPEPVRDAARRYADGAPDTTGPIEIAGSAHLPAVERPDVTASHIRAHLERIGWG